MGKEDSQETCAERGARELQEARKLWRKSPWVFVFLLLAAVLVGLVVGLYYLRISDAKHCESECARLRHEESVKQARIIELETQLAPYKSAALLKYGSDDKLSMAKLTEDVRHFDEQLKVEMAKVRTFSALIEAEFAASWKNGAPPNVSNWLRSAGGNHMMMEIEFLAEDLQWFLVQFPEDESLVHRTLPSGHVLLTMRTTAAQGGPIFGKVPGKITNLRNLRFQGAGIGRSYANGDTARLHSIDVRFFVNGKPSFRAGGTIPSGQEVKVTGEQSSVVVIPGPLPLEHVGD
jgi:hypothetical protein